jgi:glycerol-3-phosphate acyltransferase PlsY
MAETALTLLAASLLGSIPTAYVLARLSTGADIRRSGSGNAGALNAYRQLGAWAGVVVLGLDAGKGALAVYLGMVLDVPDGVVYGAALLATLGHNFSPFLKFRGGKGAATVLGISLASLWAITLVSMAFGAIVFAASRHAVWSITGVFALLNVLTIATSQSVGLISLCLVLSGVVAGTHVWRTYPHFSSALRQRQWRRMMTIE